MVGLSILIANGILGSLFVGLGSRYMDARKIALVSSFVSLAIFFYLSQFVDVASGNLQLVETYEWVPFLNVSFMMAVDGVSWVLLALTLLVNAANPPD